MLSPLHILTRSFKAAKAILRSMGPRVSKVRRSSTGSPLFTGKKFRNTAKTHVVSFSDGFALLRKGFGPQSKIGVPRGTIPLHASAASLPSDRLAVTWYGHACALLELDGYRVLTDPIWSERASPATFAGPKRLHDMPVPLSQLPRLDVVLISHDHYDHLDMKTIQYIAAHQQALFVVPLGVGVYLRSWGVAAERIIELEWGQSHAVGDVVLTSTEAQHFSGRSLVRDATLWSSWVIATKKSRVFFGGDTGYTPRFAGIGEQYGPFDAALMPVGAYDALWEDIHLNPEEAVQAHLDVRGGLLIPIHWATFNLAFHPWSEPIERLLAAAAHAKNPVDIAVPQPGERIEVHDPKPQQSWWKSVQIPK